MLDRVRALPGVAAAGRDARAAVLGHATACAGSSARRAARPAERADRRIPARHARVLRGDGDSGHAGAASSPTPIPPARRARSSSTSRSRGDTSRRANRPAHPPGRQRGAAVADGRRRRRRRAPFRPGGRHRPEMFWPAAQATWGATLNRHRRALTFVVRAHGRSGGAAAVDSCPGAALDPNRPLVVPRPMSELISRSADVARFSTVLLAHFAIGRPGARRGGRLRRDVVHRRRRAARDGNPARARRAARQRCWRQCCAAG